ncbi:MAG: LLM class flavin-dependent oxidoreductase [Chromatiales bacterium]|nr:LLM class flavin-dependent oxidoreductase [Chromatiales bacterium]
MKLDVILDARAEARELAGLGVLAERFGLQGAWVSSLPDSRDPFTNLVPMAMATRRLRLGPVAVNPFDTHPVRIASALLALNELAGGRARLVLGGGGEALDSLGIKPHRRVRAVAEAVAILRQAASGEPVSHSGEIYQVAGVRFGWSRAPAPLLLVGASQQQMLGMAARVADGVMMSDMPPAAAARAVASLDEALRERRKARPAFGASVFTALHVDDDMDLARAEARRWLLLRGIFRPWLLADFLEPAEVELVMLSRPAFVRAFVSGSDRVEGVPVALLDRLVGALTVCITPARPDALLSHIEELGRAGLDSVALRLYARPARTIRLLGREIVPAVGG